MTEHPPMLRPESQWEDEAWRYDAVEDEPNVTQKFAARDHEVARRRDHLAWWLALVFVAIGGALSIVAAAFLCQAIGL